MSGFDKKQKATVSVAVITSFITTFTGSALNLSIPALNQEFAVSAAAIGWIVTGYMLTLAVLTVPFGRIADLISRKRYLKPVYSYLWCAPCWRLFHTIGNIDAFKEPVLTTKNAGKAYRRIMDMANSTFLKMCKNKLFV